MALADDPATVRAASAVVEARARTATFTALLLSREPVVGVKRKLPEGRPRLASSAARRGSATAGVKPPILSEGAERAFWSSCFWVVAARAGASRSDIAEIGRANVGTPVNNAHLVCRLLLEKTKRR